MVSDLCQPAHRPIDGEEGRPHIYRPLYPHCIPERLCVSSSYSCSNPASRFQIFMHSLRGSIFLLVAPTKRFIFRPAHMRNTYIGNEWIVPARCIISFQYFPRQTVFYTPSTIIISEGQKLTGDLTCALNTRNDRDLDISISFKLDGEKQASRVDYKICVVLPCIATIVVSFNSEFNTHQSSGCDRPFLFCAHICSRSIRPRCSATGIEMCYVG